MRQSEMCLYLVVEAEFVQSFNKQKVQNFQRCLFLYNSKTKKLIFLDINDDEKFFVRSHFRLYFTECDSNNFNFPTNSMTYHILSKEDFSNKLCICRCAESEAI